MGGKYMAKHTSRNNNNYQQNNDTDSEAYPHLHVFPPHLLSNPIGSTAEPLGGVGEVVCLVLEGVEALSTLGDLVDVLAHHTDGIIDLLN